MRISDWSSDVCSSDLLRQRRAADDAGELDPAAVRRGGAADLADDAGVRGGLHGGAPVTDDGPVMGPMMRADQHHCWNARYRSRETSPGPRVRPRRRSGLRPRRLFARTSASLRKAPGEPLSWGMGWSNIAGVGGRSEEHTAEIQSLMRRSYAVLCS